MRLCISIRGRVRSSVRPSVRRSVLPQLFSNAEYGCFWGWKVIDRHRKQWYNEWRWSSRIWCTPAVLVYSKRTKKKSIQRKSVALKRGRTLMRHRRWRCVEASQYVHKWLHLPERRTDHRSKTDGRALDSKGRPDTPSRGDFFYFFIVRKKTSWRKRRRMDCKRRCEFWLWRLGNAC